MKNKINSHLLIFVSAVLLLPSFVLAKTETFKVKSFPTAPSTREEIQSGLELLYRNNPEQLSQISARIDESVEFQNYVYRTLQEGLKNTPVIEVETSEKVLKGNFVKQTTISFSSLVQREGDHAANHVIARIFEPSNQDKNCDYKYPATILLHHISDEISAIETAGKFISGGLLTRPAIVAVIQMPHYAQRKQGTENFINMDAANFQKNMAQLILDVHLLKNYMETRSNINANHISLAGISLGGVMGLTVGAFDQSFESYGYIVGGGDMANILMNRVRQRPGSEVELALKSMPGSYDESGKLTITEDFVRSKIASVDSMTWIHRFKNKRVGMVNAGKDDLVYFDRSVAPILNALKANNNKVSSIVNPNDQHVPGSGFTVFRHEFIPTNDFLTDGAPTKSQMCPNLDLMGSN